MEERKRKGRAVPIQQVLARIRRTHGLTRRGRDRAVLDAWKEAAGSALAQRAEAVRFRRGELVVEVSSAPLLSELKGFTGEGLRKRANELLGADRIARVLFRTRTSQ